MSDVWPPPPENQPNRTVSAPSLRRRLASVVSSGLFYSCLGASMLLSSLLAIAGHSFFLRHFSARADLFFGKLALFGFIVVIVGGTLGYRNKHTADGFAAFVISIFALTALACLVGLVLRGFV